MGQSKKGGGEKKVMEKELPKKKGGGVKWDVKGRMKNTG